MSTGDVKAQADLALSDIHLDHLFATDYDPTAKPGVATALLNELVESDAGVSRFTSNALEQIWSVSTRNLSALGFVLAAGDFGAASLNGKGDWNIGKTGYSISGAITTLDGLNNFAPGSDAVATVTDLTNLPSIPTNWLTAVGINANALDGKGDWNTVVPDVAGVAATPAEVATALTDIHLDHLFAEDYDPASKPGNATALFNELIESDGGVSRFTANAIEEVWSAVTRTLTALGTNVVNADALATDAVDEIRDAILAGTITELASIPAASPTLAQALALDYMAIRNQRDTTATSDEIHNNTDSVIGTVTVTDDTVTFRKTKYT